MLEKGVPKTSKISKLERNFWKFPSQLEFGGEHLFWGTAREVLFKSAFKRTFKTCIEEMVHFIVRQASWRVECRSLIALFNKNIKAGLHLSF